MPNYEYCRTIINHFNKGRQQKSALKFTPTGMVRLTEIEDSQIFTTSSSKKKIEMVLKDFDNSLISSGWKEIPNGDGFFGYFVHREIETNHQYSFEYCVLDYRMIIENSFWGGLKATMMNYIALQLTPKEAIHLGQSTTARMDSEQEIDDSRVSLANKMVDRGWEMISGEKDLMFRKIDSDQEVEKVSPVTTVNPTELLKQLAELRDTGALTEEEFQRKKSEILNRI